MPDTLPEGNLLGRETSPYLLQHADNPVHWRPWGPEALAEAEAENKPVLLSVGYAACHWCHVMAHESFEDATIAAQMNRDFVNIKVDREERPDIDQIYQSALALTGQPGGWPLTMFLTPQGEPFWGGTYFPPENRWGRPGFPQVLAAVRATWDDEPDKISKNVNALSEALDGLNRPQPGDGMDSDLLNKVAERLVGEIDPQWGGVGGAPKFPQPYVYELMWRAWHRTGRDGYRHAAEISATKMAQGGIYDHLGGGFARYSTDPEWLIPHFEKMLYDNALLIDLLTLLWQGTGRPLYRVRVAETVDWVLREMIADCGAFAATLDADSEGEEGKFYVWSEAEVDRVLADTGLAEHADLFKRTYEVTATGNWEGKTILNRRRQDALSDDETEAALARCRVALFDVRAKRIWPGWDDKVLADWNGLMIAALANAGLVFDEPAWIDAAVRAFDAVGEHMIQDGRLTHSLRQGRAQHAGTLDDHANLARGALALYEATGEARFLDQARWLVTLLDRHFWDGQDGGYFFTADDAEGLIQRVKNAHDNATPSGNGTMVAVLSDLFLISGEARYRDRAEAIVKAFSGEVSRNFFPLMTLFNSAERLHRAEQIVIIGDRQDAATRALMRAALAPDDPDRLITVVAPDEALPDGHPAAGKGPVDGQPAAYLCRALTCQAPVTEPEALRTLMEEARGG